MKKMTTKSDNCDKKVPVQCRMSSLGALHEKFMSESIPSSLSHFEEDCPYFVRKPIAIDFSVSNLSESGTQTGSIQQSNEDSCLKWFKDYQSLPDLIAKIEAITCKVLLSTVSGRWWKAIPCFPPSATQKKRWRKKGGEKIRQKNVMKIPEAHFQFEE